MAQHNDLGKRGEEMAVGFLLENGYEILERNWVFQKAEIDIIARKATILACVEVKTRSGTVFGLPQDFVKPAKIKLLVKAANQYVSLNGLEVDVRFDIAAVLIREKEWSIEYLEDAFYYF